MATVSKPGASLRTLLKDPPAYAAQSPWHPVAAMIAAFAVCFAAVVVFGIGVMAMAAFTGVSEAEIDTIAENMTSAETPEGVTAMIVSQLASLAAVWVLAGRKGMRREVLRLNPPKPSWGLAILLGVIVVLLSGVVEYLLYTVSKNDLFADSKWLTDGLRSPYGWGVIIIAVVLAPLWEELTFRGFLLSSLAGTRLGFWGAALIANLAWTLLHASYSIPGLISVFVAGLMLSWLVWKTGSIRAPVVAHAVFNLSAVLFAANFAP